MSQGGRHTTTGGNSIFKPLPARAKGYKGFRRGKGGQMYTCNMCDVAVPYWKELQEHHRLTHVEGSRKRKTSVGGNKPIAGSSRVVSGRAGQNKIKMGVAAAKRESGKCVKNKKVMNGKVGVAVVKEKSGKGGKNKKDSVMNGEDERKIGPKNGGKKRENKPRKNSVNGTTVLKHQVQKPIWGHQMAIKGRMTPIKKDNLESASTEQDPDSSVEIVDDEIPSVGEPAEPTSMSAYSFSDSSVEIIEERPSQSATAANTYNTYSVQGTVRESVIKVAPPRPRPVCKTGPVLARGGIVRDDDTFDAEELRARLHSQLYPVNVPAYHYIYRPQLAGTVPGQDERPWRFEVKSESEMSGSQSN